MKFVIVDGYPQKSRDQFDRVGMTLAGVLYKNMLQKYLPDAACDIYYSSDPGVDLPGESELRHYDGVLWPGCNLTVYHSHDERVTKILDMVDRAYSVGLPQFGSCWGAQIAVYVPGGRVEPNPKGREMGIARKIHLTEAGSNHPMYAGKPAVFEGFISHDDEITALPPGAEHLAGNGFSNIQAVAVRYKNGSFWATQYHPEYDLHEMARLIVAREEKLIRYGFFRSKDDVEGYVQDLEALFREPDRKDLRWKYAIDDDVLDDSVRQREFINWLKVELGVKLKI